MSLPPTSLIRILLLDSHTLSRAGIRMLLETQPDMQVIAETGDAAEAVDLAGQKWPDLILLAENLDGFSMDKTIPALLAITPRVLLIALDNNVDFHSKLVQLGVMGIFPKDQPPDMLFKAIHKVNAGEVWLDRQLTAHVINQLSRKSTDQKTDPDALKIARLSGRELEIVKLIGAGLKNRQIGDRLFISEVTVRHHLTSIFKKLHVSDRLELIIYAYRTGLAEPPD